MEYNILKKIGNNNYKCKIHIYKYNFNIYQFKISFFIGEKMSRRDNNGPDGKGRKTFEGTRYQE